MMTDIEALNGMVNFLTDAIRIGLTIKDAQVVIRISLALGVPLPGLIDQLERKPETLAKLRILLNEKDDAVRYPQNRSFLPPKE